MPETFLEALPNPLTFIIGLTATRTPETVLIIKKLVHWSRSPMRVYTGGPSSGLEYAGSTVVVYGWV